MEERLAAVQREIVPAGFEVEFAGDMVTCADAPTGRNDVETYAEESLERRFAGQRCAP